MRTSGQTRRQTLGMLTAAPLLGMPAIARGATQGRVVIVGGGFGGATCARYLRRLAPGLSVTLVERNPHFVTCPFSNLVLGGLLGIESITHSYDGLRRDGVEVVQANVEAIDPAGRELRLAGGDRLGYDRLVVSPGIDLIMEAIDGYDEAAAERMPHAWQAGSQTLLLRRQLEAMEDGGVFVMAIPQTPYRCPPGPYERASLIANYFRTHKPRSKILLLDDKDQFSKQGLFQEGWAQLYGDMIEWLPFGQTGGLIAVDPDTGVLQTEFDTHRADVANVIPPQRAGRIVHGAGLTEGGQWCRVDPRSFESVVAEGVHVLGDAVIAGAMPKSGFSAGTQAMVCARAIAALFAGESLAEPSFVNTCYSLVGPDYGITVADVFRIGPEGSIVAVQGAGGVSPMGADPEFRLREARYARGWYTSITQDIYG